MDLATGIVAATEAIKLTKELRLIDNRIDQAELKLRLVDLADRLLEAKEALQDAKEELRSLLHRISELENEIRRKGRLVDERGRLYEINEGGERIGEPYCNLCYVREGKLYRLTFQRNSNPAQYWCDNCRNAYFA